MDGKSRSGRTGRHVLGALLLVAAALPRGWCAGGGFASAVLDEAEKCAVAPEPLNCLARRGGTRAASAALAYHGEIPLLGPYLAVVPDKGAEERRSASEGRRASANETAPSLLSELAEFAGKRSLRVTLPLESVGWLIGAADAASAEGRGKKDKGAAGVLMLGGMMMITTLVSTAFGVLALMTAKGLLTSIVALMFSAMAVSKKSGHGHARTTYEVINAPQGYKLENDAVVTSDVSTEHGAVLW